MDRVHATSIALTKSNRQFLKDHVPIVATKQTTTGFSTKINRILEAKQTELQLIAALERFLNEPISYEDLQEDEQ